MKYLVINMTCDRPRLEQFLREYSGAPWERVQGIEANPAWWSYAEALGWAGDALESWAKGSIRGRVRAPLWGTIGCAIAHRICLTIAAHSDGAVIFPDDAVNPRGLEITQVVESALDLAPPGCGWIKLKNHFPRYTGRWTGDGFRELEPISRREAIRANNGSAGVIVTANAAEEILSKMPKLTSNHVDYDLRSMSSKVSGGCWELCGTGFNVARASRRVSTRRQLDQAALLP
ncbi:hypothetical protein HNR46_001299 [Haloferula luteola]|uniref:Uncharacterized protein n=1 Tax=Haloferula luteola TaxID=595692 RepID=A0A840UZ97_9BACT|nr:hypothetical protein [Haloferula luteola]MBB5351065.1 hypothetical protein [Haloferula luteola]